MTDRFLCDEMLRRLGRWLRAAGYDTVIAEGGVADRALIARAAAEARVLLTRDRHLAALAQGRAQALYLKGGGLDADAGALRAALSLDWQKAPFTICLVDNTPLLPAPEAATGQVPERSRAAGGPLRICPLCGRLYWPGSHVRRMQARLAAWAAGRPSAG
jgi:uncharacterized protein